MACLITRLIFIAIFIIGMTGFGSALRITTEPQTYNAMTKKLKISCITDGPAYWTKSIVSIQIMRPNEDTIAVINMRQELKLGDGSKDNMKADGHVDTADASKSHLTLTIDKPGRQDAGIYKCLVFFTNENIKIVEESVIGNVTFQDLNITKVVIDLAEQLDLMMDYIKQHDKTGFEKFMSKRKCLDKRWAYYADDQTCLNVFGQENHSNRRSWSDAKASCKKLGGDIVMIRDGAKNTFVYNMFEGQRSDHPWIGIRRTDKVGTNFKYVDGSSLTTYHPWHTGFPVGDEDGCVVFDPRTDYPGQWYNANCNDRKPYVCSIIFH